MSCLVLRAPASVSMWFVLLFVVSFSTRSTVRGYRLRQKKRVSDGAAGYFYGRYERSDPNAPLKGRYFMKYNFTGCPRLYFELIEDDRKLDKDNNLIVPGGVGDGGKNYLTTQNNTDQCLAIPADRSQYPSCSHQRCESKLPIAWSQTEWTFSSQMTGQCTPFKLDGEGELFFKFTLSGKDMWLASEFDPPHEAFLTFHQKRAKDIFFLPKPRV
eukprot:TRINITY_DN75649_c0_g1_i1.p1 TRINITY_DN75649_c0_g1~~TRINITY_DN75649_c0_g1_i1.p1  ORF type:complete len:214 (-),score=13.71 TRINITY_DN75649_c0_g1_i1:395-1036(-)